MSTDVVGKIERGKKIKEWVYEERRQRGIQIPDLTIELFEPGGCGDGGSYNEGEAVITQFLFLKEGYGVWVGLSTNPVIQELAMDYIDKHPHLDPH